MTSYWYVETLPCAVFKPRMRHSKETKANGTHSQLYAYFKIANGNDFSAASKPGMFDMVVSIPFP